MISFTSETPVASLIFFTASSYSFILEERFSFEEGKSSLVSIFGTEGYYYICCYFETRAVTLVSRNPGTFTTLIESS